MYENKPQVFRYKMPEPRYLLRVTVCTIVERDGKILLVREGRRPPTIPHGHLEPGEKLLDGAEREISEETGYVVKIRSLVLVRQNFFNGRGEIPDSLRFVFAGSVSGRCVRTEGDTEPFWADVNELPPGVREQEGIQEYLRGNVYPLSILRFTRK